MVSSSQSQSPSSRVLAGGSSRRVTRQRALTNLTNILQPDEVQPRDVCAVYSRSLSLGGLDFLEDGVNDGRERTRGITGCVPRKRRASSSACEDDHLRRKAEGWDVQREIDAYRLCSEEARRVWEGDGQGRGRTAMADEQRELAKLRREKEAASEQIARLATALSTAKKEAQSALQSLAVMRKEGEMLKKIIGEKDTILDLLRERVQSLHSSLNEARMQLANAMRDHYKKNKELAMDNVKLRARAKLTADEVKVIKHLVAEKIIVERTLRSQLSEKEMFVQKLQEANRSRFAVGKTSTRSNTRDFDGCVDQSGWVDGRSEAIDNGDARRQRANGALVRDSDKGGAPAVLRDGERLPSSRGESVLDDCFADINEDDDGPSASASGVSIGNTRRSRSFPEDSSVWRSDYRGSCSRRRRRFSGVFDPAQLRDFRSDSSDVDREGDYCGDGGNGGNGLSSSDWGGNPRPPDSSSGAMIDSWRVLPPRDRQCTREGSLASIVEEETSAVDIEDVVLSSSYADEAVTDNERLGSARRSSSPLSPLPEEEEASPPGSANRAVKCKSGGNRAEVSCSPVRTGDGGVFGRQVDDDESESSGEEAETRENEESPSVPVEERLEDESGGDPDCHHGFVDGVEKRISREIDSEVVDVSGKQLDAEGDCRRDDLRGNNGNAEGKIVADLARLSLNDGNESRRLVRQNVVQMSDACPEVASRPPPHQRDGLVCAQSLSSLEPGVTEARGGRLRSDDQIAGHCRGTRHSSESSAACAAREEQRNEEGGVADLECAALRKPLDCDSSRAAGDSDAHEADATCAFTCSSAAVDVGKAARVEVEPQIRQKDNEYFDEENSRILGLSDSADAVVESSCPVFVSSSSSFLTQSVSLLSSSGRPAISSTVTVRRRGARKTKSVPREGSHVADASFCPRSLGSDGAGGRPTSSASEHGSRDNGDPVIRLSSDDDEVDAERSRFLRRGSECGPAAKEGDAAVARAGAEHEEVKSRAGFDCRDGVDFGRALTDSENGIGEGTHMLSTTTAFAETKAICTDKRRRKSRERRRGGRQSVKGQQQEEDEPESRTNSTARDSCQNLASCCISREQSGVGAPERVGQEEGRGEDDWEDDEAINGRHVSTSMAVAPRKMACSATRYIGGADEGCQEERERESNGHLSRCTARGCPPPCAPASRSAHSRARASARSSARASAPNRTSDRRSSSFSARSSASASASASAPSSSSVSASSASACASAPASFTTNAAVALAAARPAPSAPPSPSPACAPNARASAAFGEAVPPTSSRSSSSSSVILQTEQAQQDSSRPRRISSTVRSYREPSLRTKMRRPD
ncbi:hypothetical protein CBR_g38555 [Chara braunii]|uniref:Uncharacterized protein n=1 Tax=Chara braunii TaxID=69332 RepID=A0A388JP26_CHABU|nr:hypothetical protein CBR_g38555 [Chara braunii]|eukprot:GBG59531.1 hypothetical protein CBR_g38555 [Chara braunii]